MCRSRPSHAAARPPDRESPPHPNRHSARSHWPYQRATDITTTRVKGTSHDGHGHARIGHSSDLLSDALPGVSFVMREGHGERLGRTLGAPYLCHPYALQIETARVLVGGTLVGLQSGESASEQSAAAHVGSSAHAVRQRTSSIRSASSPRNEMFFGVSAARISPTILFESRYELKPTVAPLGSSSASQSWPELPPGPGPA